MSSEKYSISRPDKPFWLRPPWAVLFDLIKLQRVRPWDVDLAYLLTTLIGEMNGRGYIDFTASGVALLSSATIYRMKSELILELQEPPAPPPEKVIEFIPPPIQPPFRYEYTMTTVDNLLKALDEALKAESFVETQPKLIPITPAPPAMQEIDEFLVDVDNKVEEMFQLLSGLGYDIIAFSRLTVGFKKLDAIRAFILLLFLACSDKIQLWQDEDLGEIYISVKKGDRNDGRATIQL